MPTSVVESQVYIVGHYFPHWAKCFIKAPWESLLDQAETTVLLTEPSLNSDNQRLVAALLGPDYCLAFQNGLGLNVIEVLDASVLQEIADHNETELCWLLKWRSAFVLYNRVNLALLLFHKGLLHSGYIRRPFMLLLLITIEQILIAQYEMIIREIINHFIYCQSTICNIILLFNDIFHTLSHIKKWLVLLIICTRGKDLHVHCI